MKKFAAFDIDGTLIRWQLYHTVVDRLAKGSLLGEGAHEKIKKFRMAWKNREHPDMFGQYEDELIRSFETALTRLSPSQFDAVVKQVADEYKDQVYTYTRDLIKKLKSQDYFILAISGSHHEIVEKIVKHHEFDDFTGSKYYRSSDSFSGEKSIASFNKEEELRAMINKHNLSLEDSYAVGDTKSDIAMLKLVENPIAFNPDRNLYNAAKDKGWKIVVERKNVIY